MPSIGDDRRWVIEQWETMLGRKPDRRTLEREVRRLRDGGMTRTAWVGRTSRRFAQRIVTRAYRQAGFKPSESTFNKAYWNVAAGNWTVEQLHQKIADSPRALLRDPDKPKEKRSESDAFQYMKGLLRRYGLGSLAKWAWDQMKEGHSTERIIQDLRDTDEYKTRFKGLSIRQKKGYNAMSEEEYLTYETQVRQMMRAAGLPKGFYDDPDDFAKLIGNDVSVAEMQARIMDGYQAASQAPQDVRRRLRDMYGINQGSLAAYFLDPNRALPVIERQWQAAQISATAGRTGYGQLGRRQAEGLAALGVDPDQAQQGFGELAESRELFTRLPGENADRITRDEQVAAMFAGDTDAMGKIRRRAESRVTRGSGGQGFGLTGGGVAGLGGDR
jgi:hypothetical protein